MPRVNGVKRPARYIDPDRYYHLPWFLIESGVSKTRLREARLMGHPLPMEHIGRRAYVHGAAGIEWMRGLAALTAKSREAIS